MVSILIPPSKVLLLFFHDLLTENVGIEYRMVTLSLVRYSTGLGPIIVLSYMMLSIRVELTSLELGEGGSLTRALWQ